MVETRKREDGKATSMGCDERYFLHSDKEL